MGVSVGLVVRVGMALGLGKMVDVGGWVCVGDPVKVLVTLGTSVHEGAGLGEACLMQATSEQAITKTNINLKCLLLSDGEE